MTRDPRGEQTPPEEEGEPEVVAEEVQEAGEEDVAVADQDVEVLQGVKRQKDFLMNDCAFCV